MNENTDLERPGKSTGLDWRASRRWPLVRRPEAALHWSEKVTTARRPEWDWPCTCTVPRRRLRAAPGPAGRRPWPARCRCGVGSNDATRLRRIRRRTPSPASHRPRLHVDPHLLIALSVNSSIKHLPWEEASLQVPPVGLIHFTLQTPTKVQVGGRVSRQTSTHVKWRRLAGRFNCQSAG